MYNKQSVDSNLNNALANYQPLSFLTINGIYLKLPRKKDDTFLSYKITAGGYEADIIQGFVYRKFTNPQWQVIITDIKTDTENTFLKFSSGWAISIFCNQIATKTLQLKQTSSSSEYDNAPNQGVIKTI